MQTVESWVEAAERFKRKLELVDYIPIRFLENSQIAHMTLRELIGDYDIDELYGGDIVNWLVDEWRNR